MLWICHLKGLRANMNLVEIKNALLTVGVPVSHYSADKKPDKYIVWAEDSQSGSLHGDNQMIGQIIQGTVDYFTKTEYDPNVDKIQDALNEAEISFRLNSVQYEDDTKFIHYEYIFEVENNG